MTGTSEYKNNWQKEHFDRINLTVRKGVKAEIQDHAAIRYESVTRFINRAIRETMERDQKLAELEAIFKGKNMSTEEQQKMCEIMQAVELIESQIPGFKDFYHSGQIPSVIAHRIRHIGPETTSNTYK